MRFGGLVGVEVQIVRCENSARFPAGCCNLGVQVGNNGLSVIDAKKVSEAN